MTSVADFKRMKDDYTEKLKKDGKAALMAAFQEFFKQHPEIHALQWRQYTPYFNDGDTCEFGVHSPDYYFTHAAQGKTWEDDAEFARDEEWNYYDGKLLRTFWDSLGDQDIFESTFGDHVRVIATREGFTVLNYEHD